MRDRLTKERRSWNMSRIRGKDTTPELVVRRLLHKLGYRFRLHVRIPVPQDSRFTSIPPRPSDGRGIKGEGLCKARVRCRIVRSVSVDILLPKYKTALLVHGCFWHRHKGCKNCTTPTHQQKFWLTKLNGNAARDILQQAALKKLGWRVIVIWECEIDRPNLLARKIAIMG